MDNEELKMYFDNMFSDIDPDIKLDSEQREAITADDDKILVIAGAGTGKTTTMAAKVKYLVDIKRVEPTRILVMSYTKKATMELQNLIVDQFGIDAHVTTFHSLGYEYIREIFNNRICYVLDSNEKEQIFYDYFCEIFKNKTLIKNIIDNFSTYLPKDRIVSKYFLENYINYDDYNDFFNDYKKYKIKEAKNRGIKNVIDYWIDNKINAEAIITIKGELVKSAGEAKIANFLFTHGIHYSYEEVYTEIMDDRKSYKPDFTLDLAGEKVYLEYFGLEDEKYNKVKERKIEFHKKYNDGRFIYIEKTSLDNIENELDEKLKLLGFNYKNKTEEEIYDEILNNNKLSNVFWFKNFLFEVVETIKEYNEREKVNEIVDEYINSLSGLEKEQALFHKKVIFSFYKYYFDKAFTAEKYGFDYSDLIYYANKYLNILNGKSCGIYDYIIIDEYQDISREKYLLTKNTLERCNSKLFVVGDDWQSIYSFSGSNIEYIYRIREYFPNIKLFTISKTYRNAQELIDAAGNFVMKNKYQINKNLTSNKSIENPIIFKEYSKTDSYSEYDCLKETIREIHKNNPNHSIMILARRNKDIDRIFDDNDFSDSLDTKIIFREFKDLEIDGMSIHKSKGLTCDEVIVIGLNNSFPSEHYENFWMQNLLKSKPPSEGIPFAEERRLFYVALTRTRNHVYLLKNKDSKYRSNFIDELEEILNNK